MDSTLATTVSEMAIELLIACAPFLALAPLLLFSVVLVALVGVSVFNKVAFVLRLLVQLVRVIIGVISFLVSVVGFPLRFINEMKAAPESEDSDHTRATASGESSYEYTDWDDQEEEEEPDDDTHDDEWDRHDHGDRADDWYRRPEDFDDDKHWSILGLKPNSSYQETKRAYWALMKQHHPDRAPRDCPSLLAAYTRKAQELQAAYEALRQLNSWG